MEKNEKDRAEVYSARVRAGKRTYFFDVKATRGNDFYITITESKRRFNSDGYDKHKIFLYKEDFNKFLGALQDTIEHVKSERMPEYDYHDYDRDSVSIKSDLETPQPKMETTTVAAEEEDHATTWDE